jgi:hypothetical protein
MKSKKAQVQVQFNWIYVSIAGAVILSIFVGIAIRMNQNAKEQIARDAINYFDEIFTSVQASENTENEISLPGLDLEVDTDEVACDYYSIAGTDKSEMPIDFTPFFSPHIIRTRILSYALGWDMPFRVNYFIYMTSPEVAYVSVGENKIMSELPEHLTLESVDDAYDFENENYYKGRLFTTIDPESFNRHNSFNRHKDVSAIQINEASKSLTFYEYDSGSFEEQGTTYYLDDTTLIAAIYSESLGSYECNMIKSIERLNRFSTLLKNRASIIKNSDLLSICSSSSYSTAESLLDDMEELTSQNKLDQSTVSGLISIRTELESLNKELNKKSCPTIY